jgi:hypothetical protein
VRRGRIERWPVIADRASLGCPALGAIHLGKCFSSDGETFLGRHLHEMCAPGASLAGSENMEGAGPTHPRTRADTCTVLATWSRIGLAGADIIRGGRTGKIAGVYDDFHGGIIAQHGGADNRDFMRKIILMAGVAQGDYLQKAQ